MPAVHEAIRVVYNLLVAGREQEVRETCFSSLGGHKRRRIYAILSRPFCLTLEAEDIEHETFIIAAETRYPQSDSLELVRTCYPEVHQVRDQNAFLVDRRRSLFHTTKTRDKPGWTPQFLMEENPSEL